MKKLILILFILISNIGLGQTQYVEEKCAYQNEVGKLYWNKSLPIYITLSSPLLNGVVFEKPFYLDTEGINLLRTKWEMDSLGKYTYPLKEQVWRIYADSKPPKTTSKFISKTSYEFRSKRYYGDDLKVVLHSKDELSGVNKIYYSINNSGFLLYEKSITFGAGIDIDLKFYSVDNVGNVEKIEELSYNYDNNTLNFGVDNKAPETFIIDEDIKLFSPKDNIKIESGDIDGVGVNSIYYSFDTTFRKYEKPISLLKLTDGEHKMKYFAVDWVNNKEDEKTFEFYLDAIPPEIIVNELIIKDGLTNLREITLTVTDNKSGVDNIMVQLRNDGEYKEYTKPFLIDISLEKLTIKAIDSVGNETIRIVNYNIIK